jgi:diacylglycerol O-acyltransferase
MKHLSGLDAAFLHIESPEMPMHIGSLNVLRLPDGYQGDFYEDVKAHMASRIHLAELFTPQAGADALRPVRPGLGGRRRL